MDEIDKMNAFFAWLHKHPCVKVCIYWVISSIICWIILCVFFGDGLREGFFGFYLLISIFFAGKEINTYLNLEKDDKYFIEMLPKANNYFKLLLSSSLFITDSALLDDKFDIFRRLSFYILSILRENHCQIIILDSQMRFLMDTKAVSGDKEMRDRASTILEWIDFLQRCARDNGYQFLKIIETNNSSFRSNYDMLTCYIAQEYRKNHKAALIEGDFVASGWLYGNPELEVAIKRKEIIIEDIHLDFNDYGKTLLYFMFNRPKWLPPGPSLHD